MNSNEDVNPYASPSPEREVSLSSAELGEPLGELQGIDLLADKQPWKLLLFAEVLRFEVGDGGEPFDIPRIQFADKAIIHDTIFMRRSLQVKIGKQKALQFSEDDFAKLMEWIGPLSANDLKVALKRRVGWAFPIGLFLVVTSMPLGGDPQLAIDALPFDPINCGLGVSLCMLAVFAKLRPHRLFFLIDSLWFLVIAGKTSVDIFSGLNWWWLIIVMLQLSLVASGIKQFRRFGTQLHRSDATR